MYNNYKSNLNKDQEVKKPVGTAMAAAALQQHLSLSLGLPTIKPRGAKRVAPRPRKRDEEYVLDARPPQPTLAQKLGLAPPPPAVLSEVDWAEVKSQSVARGDSTAPCVICKEDFGQSKQVLLSCSHVFHKHCLQAFEKYTGRKTCPMCRRDRYETRIIHEGAQRHKETCATRIQAAWRGYVIRKWYHQYRERNPPIDPMLREKYYEKKLSGITSRIVEQVNKQQSTVDTLCRDIDEQLAHSRSVMNTAHFMSCRLSLDKWRDIEKKALDRGLSECPICIVPLSNNRRPLTLLSCTHVYHRTCIDQFENLTTDISHTCPVCRSSYLKKKFKVPEF